LLDQDRGLTPNGRRDIRAVSKLAFKAREIPQVILTSPLRRAKETAEIAAGVLGCTRIEETTALAPEAAPEQIWQELGRLPARKSVMLVGHEPHTGLLIQFLLAAQFPLKVRKAGLVKMTTGSRKGRPQGRLEWMLAPRLIRKA
jgi:phosphohistidine phosphatase